MEEILLNVLVFLLLVTILVAVFWFYGLPLYRIWNQHSRIRKDIDKIDQTANQRIIKAALRELNCKGTWVTEGNDRVVKFDFQRGHFRLRVRRGTPYVRLLYLFFCDTSAENIDLVRQLCNQTNINADGLTACYTFNEKENVVDVHFYAALLLDEQRAASMLKHVMIDAFSWQNAFVRKLEEGVEHAKRAGMFDFETEHQQFERELFLIREQEMAHQQTPGSWRAGEDSPLTLHLWMEVAMQLHETVPVALTVDGQTVEADDRLNLAEMLIADRKFVKTEATLSYTFYQASDLTRERSLVLHLLALPGCQQTLYFRITATLVPLSIQPRYPQGNIQAQPLTRSALAAYDLSSSDERLQEFRYHWKEAQAKLMDGSEENLSPDERILSECLNPQVGHAVYRGRQLFLSERYVEALPWLENAFRLTQNAYEKMPPAAREHFYEVCYCIGFAYCQLEQYDKAYFYLNLVFGLNRVTYTEAFVNCLVNSNDFRAVTVIDTLLAEVTRGMEEGAEKAVYAVGFRNFLLRRKATLLIRRHLYTAAEVLLKALLNEPDSSDYALNELALLQKIRAVDLEDKATGRQNTKQTEEQEK